MTISVPAVGQTVPVTRSSTLRHQLALAGPAEPFGPAASGPDPPAARSLARSGSSPSGRRRSGIGPTGRRETEFMRLSAQAGARARAATYRPVPLDSIAPALAEAAVTAEDARFWVHSRHRLVRGPARAGLSARRLRVELGPGSGGNCGWALGSVLQSDGSAIRGASTITQQLAKNLYLSPSRNPLRKLKEAVTAYRLETALRQATDPRALPQRRRAGSGDLGRRGGEPALLPEVGAAAHRDARPRRSRPRCRFRSSVQPGLPAGADAAAAGADPAADATGSGSRCRRSSEEPVPQPGDSIMWTPGMDSLLDSLRAPVETLPPALVASVRQSTSRSGITSVR